MERLKPASVRVSIIMPVDRPGADASRAIAAVLHQQTSVPFELLLVPPHPLDMPADTRIRQIPKQDRNAAARRNLAAAEAKGEILGFIDDDAFADPHWIANAVRVFDSRPEVIALGGPDPAPADSLRAEQISETLLATRLVGSGVVAHEGPAGTRDVLRGHQVALVNLFTRAEAFREAGGFDEAIGYIGEDTALVERLLARGKVVYDGGVVVRHRRRPFPGPYLRQRWRYRVKSGRMLATGRKRWSANPSIVAFLGAAALFALIAMLWPLAGAVLGGVYVVTVTVLGIRSTPLPARWYWVIPIAFAAHHATYLAGLIAGLAGGMVSRLRRSE